MTFSTRSIIRLLSALFFVPSFAIASTITIELRQTFTPKLKEGSGRLWIPLPTELKGYQQVLDQKITGNANNHSVEEVGPQKVRMLKADWKNQKDPLLEVVTKVKLQKRKAIPSDQKSAGEFLKPSRHIQTDGIVLETAQKITGSAKTSDAKARAIYDWIIANAERDPKVRGCGLGDVKSTLTVGNLKGKCADLNTLFVGLARAAGVPARETFGLRVAESKLFASLGKSGDVSKGQHCRAEYYSKEQKAWIPVDPADVRKAILEEKLSKEDKRIKRLADQLFGSWEENWIAFNQGRDFEIPDGQDKIQINYFMYPRMRTADFEPDGMDPSEVSYSLKSTKL